MLIHFITQYKKFTIVIFIANLIFFFFFFLFMATPAAYGNSQAKSLIGVAAASLCHRQQCQIQVTSVTYISACSSAQILNMLIEARD